MLGDPSVSGRESPPTTDALVGVRAISVGSNHACAITTSDGLRCWGDDNSGEVGDGMPSVGPSTPPTDVILTGVRAVAAGGAQTCALMLAGGGVRCWGTAQSGALGDGSTDQRWTPPATDILTGVPDIASGGTFLTCAIMTGGGVRCWGSNAYGQAGNGMSGVNADVLTPTPPLRELSGACP
jgi:alpha-tubulin suppressor-like RCC1 family protein